MNINKINNIISFQKQLKATCLLKKDTAQICNIYEINKNDDPDYFETFNSDKNWEDNEYLSCVNHSFERGMPLFVLEDENSDCLGYISTFDTFEMRDGDVMGIDFVETIPTQQHLNNNRIKYIGETLLAFAAQQAKKAGKAAIYVYEYSRSAQDFYKKLGFNESFAGTLKLNKNKFDGLISQNKNHANLELNA